MFSRLFLSVFGATTLIAFLCLPASAAHNPARYGTYAVQTFSGDLHIGADGDAHKAGVPLYPGARPKKDDDDSGALDFGLLTQAFGLKFVVAKYESDDSPAKVVEFYRKKLKKYGDVLECHAREAEDDAQAGPEEQPSSLKLKCDDNSGPVTELKVGTEHNQRVVAVEPRASGKGSTFSVIYIYSRKEADI